MFANEELTSARGTLFIHSAYGIEDRLTDLQRYFCMKSTLTSAIEALNDVVI